MRAVHLRGRPNVFLVLPQRPRALRRVVVRDEGLDGTIRPALLLSALRRGRSRFEPEVMAERCFGCGCPVDALDRGLRPRHCWCGFPPGFPPARVGAAQALSHRLGFPR